MLSFDAIAKQYSGMLYRHIYRMLGNVEDAQDVLQDVLLQVYRKLHTYKGDASLKNWLFRIASNRTIDHIRKRNRRPETALEQDIESSADPLRSAQRSHLRSELSRALLMLTREHREVVVMKEIDGFTFREIGEILDIPENTAKTRLYTALRKLRECLHSNGRFEPSDARDPQEESS